MKLKNDNYQLITYIQKLELVKKEVERVKKEIFEIQKKFQNFVSELDEGYNFDRMSIDQKIVELNIIVAKGDDLENELEILDSFMLEMELQLMN